MLKTTWNDLFLHGTKLFPRVAHVSKGVACYTHGTDLLAFLQINEIIIVVDFWHDRFVLLRQNGRLYYLDSVPHFLNSTEPLCGDET